MTNFFNPFAKAYITDKPEFFSQNNQPLDNLDNNCTIPDTMLFEMPDHLLNMRLVVAQQENDYLGEWEIEIIKKARFYNIPYQPNNIDWAELDHEINEYENLLDRALELNFDWDTSIYDPVGLRCAIIECEQNNETSWYYNFLAKLGVKKHA